MDNNAEALMIGLHVSETQGWDRDDYVGTLVASRQMVDFLIGLIEDTVQFSPHWTKVHSISYLDHSVNYFEEPSLEVYDDEENETFLGALEDARKSDKAFLVTGQALPRDLKPMRVDNPRIVVYGNFVEWRARKGSTDTDLCTNMLTIEQLLALRMYYMADVDPDRILLQLLDIYPRMALRIVKEGLHVVGRDPIRFHFRPETLQTLIDEPRLEGYDVKAAVFWHSEWEK